MINDNLHVVHPRVAGLDVHKMRITASVRICEASGGEARCETREFSALPSGLDSMVEWLCSHGVTACGMEGTGVYWQAPWSALDEAGIEVELYHAQHVKQLRATYVTQIRLDKYDLMPYITPCVCSESNLQSAVV